MWKKAIYIFSILLVLVGIYAATYEVSYHETVRIDYAKLEGSRIIVNALKTYVPFDIIIEDVPPGIYVLEIPEEELETIICGPGVFNVTTIKDIYITCIAKPTKDIVDVRLIRWFNNTYDVIDFTFEIVTKEIWYEVWSGGIELNYYITNGIYIIEHKPRQLVSQIIVKKGQEIVWSGLMFPGQEEKITEDLKIKFLGALDNVTYLKVYSTSDDKFYLVSAKPKIVERIIKEYIFPRCEVQNGWIIIENVNATIIYEDGSNETINAERTTVRLRSKDVAQVVCGYILNIKPIQLETKPTVEEQKEEEKKPRFIIAPLSKYYVGDVVKIVATDNFEISCADGTYMQTKIFTKKFDEPTSCTVILGDIVKSFEVEEKKAVQPQVVEKRTEKDYRWILWIVLGAAIIYLLYRWFKEREFSKILSSILSTKEKTAAKEEKRKEEEEEIEYRVKSSLEGTH